MSVSPARRVALDALGRVRREHSFSGPVLAGALSKAGLSGGDTALATRLTYGVLSAEGILDEVVNRYAKGSLEPRVRDALRLGAFEMLYGRAPAYAVVSQTVDAVRHVSPKAAGLANAVMRRVGEAAADFPWGDPETNLGAAARLGAYPMWIADVAVSSLGEQAAREMLLCGAEAAPSYVRLDPFAADREKTLAELRAAGPVASPPDDDCFELTNAGAAFGASAEVRGWFGMDAAAQMAPIACEPWPGLKVLDLGAGRGNKTVCLQSIAVRQGGPAEITALDVHEGKTERLRERLDASGVPGVTAVAGDGMNLEALFGPSTFDVVLLDAPCSGLGTLRRYPEKRWRIDPGTPARMAELQGALLESAARVVRPGGRVVYSTCSVAREENADVVRGFLDGPGRESFEVDALDRAVPDRWAEFLDGCGGFQSWPKSGGPDGHYVAAVRRR